MDGSRGQFEAPELSSVCDEHWWAGSEHHSNAARLGWRTRLLHGAVAVRENRFAALHRDCAVSAAETIPKTRSSPVRRAPRWDGTGDHRAVHRRCLRKDTVLTGDRTHLPKTRLGGVSVSRPVERTSAPLTIEHLQRLSELAALDRERFYVAQPLYRGRLVATVLAQGAALHWVNGTNGVKDLDVWSFFALPPEHGRFVADRRETQADFGPSALGRQQYDLTAVRNGRQRSRYRRWQLYEGRRVDLMMRGLQCPLDADPAVAIRQWLLSGRPGSSPWWLAKKAIILIDPPERRGELVWPSTQPA
jgi:hypothetical protein